jgi:hypothetical protein
MKPGKELDALVAEKVMGLVLGFMSEEDIEPSVVVDQATMSFDVIPHYSTDIAAAWEVLDSLAVVEADVTISNIPPEVGFTGYVCRILAQDFKETIATSEVSAPHAISLAALKAVGVEL